MKQKSSSVLSTRVPVYTADRFRELAHAEGKSVTAALAELVEERVRNAPPVPKDDREFSFL